mgnify:CR=1 FL=1
MTQNVCVSVQMDEKSFHDFASFDLLRHLSLIHISEPTRP